MTERAKSGKSKFSVRSAEMRRICTGLGRGRRHICVANGRPVRRRFIRCFTFYGLSYLLANVAPAPTGIIKPFASPINQNLSGDCAASVGFIETL